MLALLNFLTFSRSTSAIKSIKYCFILKPERGGITGVKLHGDIRGALPVFLAAWEKFVTENGKTTWIWLQISLRDTIGKYICAALFSLISS